MNGNLLIDSDLKKPNVFQADGQKWILNQEFTVSIPCHHCRHLDQFAMVGQGVSYQKLPNAPTRPVKEYRASLRICPNPTCQGIVAVLQEGKGRILTVMPPELIDFTTDNLPARLVATLSEAVACHAANAYRAAALMVRRLLEELCDENGMTGKDLHQRIAALKSKILIPEALYDAMWELKALGNDAAHVRAKDYDQIGPEESADCIELAKEILKAVYQHRSLVDRLSARKKGAAPQIAP